MFDILEDSDTEDIIKGSIVVHELVLEKIMTKKYIFIIGEKEYLLDFIEDFKLDVEPLQIDGDNILKLKREGGGFQYTYFVKKDDNLRKAMNIIYNDTVLDFDPLIGIELNKEVLSHIAFKKGEEFTVKNAERYINIVFPIADLDDIKQFNSRANEKEVIESFMYNLTINDTR